MEEAIKATAGITKRILDRAKELHDPEIDALLRELVDVASASLRKKLMEDQKIMSRAKELARLRRNHPNAFIVNRGDRWVAE